VAARGVSGVSFPGWSAAPASRWFGVPGPGRAEVGQDGDDAAVGVGARPYIPLFRHAAATGDLRTVLAAAAGEATRRGDREIGVAHLRIGALAGGDGGAVRLLRALIVDAEAVREELVALLGARSTSYRWVIAITRPLWSGPPCAGAG
jgi:hypothetical protein